LRALRARHPPLGSYRSLYRIRDVGINYNRASVARRVLYAAPIPDDPRDLPRYRGRNFARYTGITVGGWLRHNAPELLAPAETLSLDFATYRAEKIVFRQTADRLIATLDRGGAVMGRSVIAITREADVSLLALLACLNSRLLSTLYGSLAEEEGRILPQVKVSRVAALPVPDVCALPLSDALRGEARDALADSVHCGTSAVLERAREDAPFAWACLHELAARCLAVGGADRRLDALIDAIVDRLYGVSPGGEAAELVVEKMPVTSHSGAARHVL
jgi:hypothetical protein